MARFVDVPSQNGDVVLVNTEHIEQVGFRPKQEKPAVFLFLRGKATEDYIEAIFSSDEDALDWIHRNFILFNK